MNVRFAKALRGVGTGLPPRRYIVGFLGVLAFWLACEWGVLLLINSVAGEWQDARIADMFARLRMYHVVIAGGLVLLAEWRAVTYNPAIKLQYQEWLRLTPWAPGRPLPFAGVSLTWFDAAAVALATWLWSLPQNRAVVALAFAVPYAASVAYALLQAGEMWSVFGAIALALGLPLTIGHPWWETAALAAGLCAYCDWAFRRSLVRFPWDDAPRILLTARRDDVSLHWPRLRDGEIVENKPLITWRWAGASSLLVGWAALVATYLGLLEPRSQHDPEGFRQFIWTATGAFAAVCAFARALIYAGDRWSPLGPWARLRLGRWIVPGHDRVYVPSLLVTAIGIGLPPALFALRVPVPLTAAATVTCSLLAALGARPTLAEWSLTGEYRTQMARQGVRREWVQVA